MDKKRLLELAERYQRKADAAYRNYQESGITRYDTARRNNEELADAFRMAANASDDHSAMISLRGDLSMLAGMAQSAGYAAEDMKQKKLETVARELVSVARIHGLIGGTQ